MPLKRSTKRREADDEEAKNRRISLRKEELLREVNYGISNTGRIRRSWREAMMRVKMPIFQEQVEVTWHTFDRSLDVKDHGANLIIEAVEKAREQYEKNFSSHAEAVDRLIQIYGTRLRDWENRYLTNLEELVTTCGRERLFVEERQDKDDVSLRSVIFGTKYRLEESLSDARSGTIAKVDLLKESKENSRRIMAALVESEMNSRWSELRGILDNYESSTKQRRRAYEIIRVKDDRERKIINRQVSTTTSRLESIRKFRDKIGGFGAIADGRVSEITAEHKFFHDAYHTAKERFLSEQRRDKARLVFLTKEYNLTTKRLRKLVKKAEKILLLAHECSKYETEDEKILLPSIMADSLSGNEENEILNNDLGSLEVTFWRRVGAAQVITTELGLERARLAEESQFLKESLGQCLEDRDNIR